MLWTLIIGTELFLLLDDITLFRAPKSELPEITGERIAELRDRVGGVRWQNPKDVVWNETRGGQALYEGQSVMTLSDSSARLVFDARDDRSTEIEIGPKTLLQLRSRKPGENRPLLLALERGTFRAKASRAIELAAGEFTVQIAAGSKFEAESVESARSKSGKPAIRLKVLEGSARAGAAEVTRDQSLEVPITAKGEAAVLPVVVAEPRAEASASPAPSPTPSPTPTPPPAPRARKARALPPPSLEAPVFRRRVKPSPTSGAPSGRFDLFDFLFPSAAADDAGEEWEIEFRWVALPGAKNYRVEVARTRDFSKKLAEETTAEPHWAWPYRRGMENSKGRVFYRVAAVDESGKVGKFSDPKPFSIPGEILHPVTKAAPPTPPPAPEASVARTTPPPVGAVWSVRPAAELTSRTQTSDSTANRRVETGGAFVHEAISAARVSEDWNFAVDFRANQYRSDSGALAKTRSYRGGFEAETRTAGLRGKLFFGGALLVDDRFEKDGANALKLTRGFSLGPSASVRASGWTLALRIPLTGAFLKDSLGGPYGPALHAERDFVFSPSVSVSLYAEGSAFLWGEPSGGRVTEWSVGLGPKAVFR